MRAPPEEALATGPVPDLSIFGLLQLTQDRPSERLLTGEFVLRLFLECWPGSDRQ